MRKINLSTCSDFSLDLWALTISPTVENTLSEGTEVAGIQRYFFAKMANEGYLSLSCLHQVKGFPVAFIDGSSCTEKPLPRKYPVLTLAVVLLSCKCLQRDLTLRLGELAYSLLIQTP